MVQPGSIKSEWAAIAADNLLEHSKDTKYQSLVEPMARALRNPPMAADPEVIAKAVSKAVNSPRPRRRYATPMDAKLFISLRWLLPEWAWEGLISTAIR